MVPIWGRFSSFVVHVTKQLLHAGCSVRHKVFTKGTAETVNGEAFSMFIYDRKILASISEV